MSSTNQVQQPVQVAVVDLLDRAAKSGIQYTPEEVKQELYYSTLKVDGINDDTDINGEKIYIIQGPHGIGKTALTHQFGNENAMEVFAFNLGGTVQEDLHGNPDIKKLADGTNITGHAAAALAPPFFRKPNSPSGRGIWLLDEIFSGTSMDHQLFVRMVAGRRCDEMKMFPGWTIVGTTNPNTNSYMAVKKIDASTADRFIVFNVYTNADLKLAHWRGRMNPLMFKFLLLMNVRKLSHVDATSARNWWNLAVEVYKRRIGGASIRSIENMIATHVSLPVAQDFITYLSHGDDPNYYPIGTHEILSADKTQLRQLIARIEHWAKKGEVSMLGATKWDLAEFMRDDLVKKNIKLEDSAVQNIAEIMKAMGGNGYVDMCDSVFDAISGSVHQDDLLELTRDSKLRVEQLRVQRADKLEKAAGRPR